MKVKRVLGAERWWARRKLRSGARLRDARLRRKSERRNKTKRCGQRAAQQQLASIQRPRPSPADDTQLQNGRNDGFRKRDRRDVVVAGHRGAVQQRGQHPNRNALPAPDGLAASLSAASATISDDRATQRKISHGSSRRPAAACAANNQPWKTASAPPAKPSVSLISRGNIFAILSPLLSSRFNHWHFTCTAGVRREVRRDGCRIRLPGSSLRWTFQDGPMAGKSFDHASVATAASLFAKLAAIRMRNRVCRSVSGRFTWARCSRRGLSFALGLHTHRRA